MNKEQFLEIQKKYLNWVHPLEEKLINDFFKVKRNKIDVEGLKFGEAYEYFVAWIFNNKKQDYKKYITLEEQNGKKIKNSGLDIIFPDFNKKIIYFVQVKTGNYNSEIFSSICALEKRADEFFNDLESSEITVSQMYKTWQISKNVISKMKDIKDGWGKIKTIWLTNDYYTKNIALEERVKNTKTAKWSIFDIIISLSPLRKINSPSTKEHDLVITAKFSNNKKNAIVKEMNKVITSVVIPIEIMELKKFFRECDEKGNIEELFYGNVRLFQGETKLFKKITNSLNEHPEDFYLKNNGITIITNKIEGGEIGENSIKGTYKIYGVNIINGQQTAFAIHKGKISNNSEAYVLVKAIVVKDKTKIVSIAEATNRQKSIKTSELISSQKFNSTLQDVLLRNGIIYKFKKGRSEYQDQFKGFQVISLKDLIKFWYIKQTGDVWIKNRISKLMDSIFIKEKNSNKNIANATKLFYQMDDKEKVNSFKKIGNDFIKFNSFKSKIKLPASFDMYSYFYMKNPIIATDKKFIEYFNKTVWKMSNEKLKVIETDNIDNIFKTKKHSKEIFDSVEEYFNRMKI